jgi:hypothetical protein
MFASPASRLRRLETDTPTEGFLREDDPIRLIIAEGSVCAAAVDDTTHFVHTFCRHHERSRELRSAAHVTPLPTGQAGPLASPVLCAGTALATRPRTASTLDLEVRQCDDSPS